MNEWKDRCVQKYNLDPLGNFSLSKVSWEILQTEPSPTVEQRRYRELLVSSTHYYTVEWHLLVQRRVDLFGNSSAEILNDIIMHRACSHIIFIKVSREKSYIIFRICYLLDSKIKDWKQVKISVKSNCKIEDEMEYFSKKNFGG